MTMLPTCRLPGAVRGVPGLTTTRIEAASAAAASRLLATIQATPAETATTDTAATHGVSPPKTTVVRPGTSTLPTPTALGRTTIGAMARMAPPRIRKRSEEHTS